MSVFFELLALGRSIFSGPMKTGMQIGSNSATTRRQKPI